jgi:hypothetical protein
LPCLTPLRQFREFYRKEVWTFIAEKEKGMQPKYLPAVIFPTKKHKETLFAEMQENYALNPRYYIMARQLVNCLDEINTISTNKSAVAAMAHYVLPSKNVPHILKMIGKFIFAADDNPNRPLADEKGKKSRELKAPEL